MRRRWFFRVTSLTLLLLCLGAWGWSLRYTVTIQYVDERETGLQLQEGRLRFYQMTKGLFPEPQGLSYSHGEYLDYRVEFETSLPETPPGGFQLHHSESNLKKSGLMFLGVPLWFPTLLLAALTWWTWRKTRGKDGRGFAMESPPASSPGDG